MNLDDAQRKKVAEWIAQGLKLSEIQTRIGSELGLQLTYMDVRFLVDDLKLVPKDIEPPKDATSTLSPLTPAGTAAAASTDTSTAASPGTLSLNVDQIARPGTMVSGQVTFSDGKTAGWYFDQTGRL